MHTFQLGERRSTTTVYLHRFAFALFFFFCLTFNKWTLLIVEGEEDGSSSVMQWLRDLKQKFLHDEEEEEKDEEDLKDEDVTFEAVDFLLHINSPKRWEVLRAAPEEFTFAHTEVLLSLL